MSLTPGDILNTVTSREDFLSFMSRWYVELETPFMKKWLEIPPNAYMHGVADAARNMEAYCQSHDLPFSQEPTWGEFALMLGIAAQPFTEGAP